MKPALLYDGDCGFCRYWVARWQTRTGDAVEYLASRDASGRFPGIAPDAFTRSVQFVDANGAVYSGAAAVFRCLAHAPGIQPGASAYRRVPGFAQISEFIYRLIANRRGLASSATRIFWGSRYEPPRFLLARWLFLRNLGAIFFVAFLSLYGQIDGLIGENGILPASELNQLAVDQLGGDRFTQLPTLYWFHPTDGFLHALCLAGMLASVLIVAGLLTPLSIFIAFASYLSLVNVGRDFLSFQWDILLLETAFLAMFLAPMQLLPRFSKERRPFPCVLGLHWWLLFRLMFASGWVKLSDPTWTRLEALNVHYETQPLPTLAGWYFHQLPELFQKLSVAAMFAVELGAPFLIFFPRRIRHAGALAMIAFQLLIMLTGNYTFFNWLTVALCLLLFDDQSIRGVLRRSRRAPAVVVAALSPATRRARAFGVVVALVMGFLSLTAFTAQLTRGDVPRFALELVFRAQSFHVVGTYGLFAHMTTSRPEIVIEGSSDGVEWRPYRFTWKPGDLDRRPRRVAPFQPRLDWQMWFAALGSPNTTPWFSSLLLRLLQGSPEVLGLLDENPFPGAPPEYIRAQLYDYRFTNLDQRRASGNWWRREYRGIYFPQANLPPELRSARP